MPSSPLATEVDVTGYFVNAACAGEVVDCDNGLGFPGLAIERRRLRRIPQLSVHDAD